MNKFHMKNDQSGPALCQAQERSCPNGEFGHYETAAEVYIAYEAYMAAGEAPSISAFKTLKRDSISEARKAMVEALKSFKTFDAYISAVNLQHPLDVATQEKFLKKHHGDSSRDLKVRSAIARLTQARSILSFLADDEKSDAVAHVAVSNLYMDEDSANLLESRMGPQSKTAEANKLRKEKARRDAQEIHAKKPRELAETVKAIFDLTENFQNRFMKVDKALKELANKLEGAGDQLTANAIRSGRTYERALVFGGIYNKSAIESVRVRLKTESVRIASKLAKEMQPILDEVLPGYEASIDKDVLKIAPASKLELEEVYKARKA